MAGRLDPPHERVTLSLDELCTLARLEEAFGQESAADHPPPEPDRQHRLTRLRRTLSAGLLRAMHVGPWLIPVGVVVMLAALTWSTGVSLAGAALVVVGLATCVWRLRLRRAISRLSGRHRRIHGPFHRLG